MSDIPSPGATLEEELAQIERLLATDAALAAKQAARILSLAPGHPVATFWLGVARRFTGDAAGSIDALKPLTRSEPDWAAAHYEFGRACGAAGRGDEAVAALRRAVELQPALTGAWCSLADELRAAGDAAGADAVCAQRFELASRDPRLQKADAALREKRFAEANTLLRQHLQEDPTDALAMQLLAAVFLRLGQFADAGKLLARCLELAPNYAAAHHDHALVLDKQTRRGDALRAIERALEADPGKPDYRNVQAVLLDRVGEYDRAIEVYASLLDEYPEQPKVWTSYGHALRAAGRQADSVAAYQKAIEHSPDSGEAWWSLADFKTFTFSAEEIDEMWRQLERAELSDEDRVHFEFTLGKALEDAGDYPGSFEHYAEGNRLRRATTPYEAAQLTAGVQRSKALFTPAFFADRADCGSAAEDPVFIVGLPRSGSTLLEQILASHSAVEGTMELPHIAGIAKSLDQMQLASGDAGYLTALASLNQDQLREIGDAYVEKTRVHRKLGRAYFIDKMPNNYAHIGLIHLMLPNARIIDVRRHPLACGLSLFKEHFADAQNFAYSLENIGRYYRSYVELMTHFDAVLPGRVHRVIYESLVENTESEVRRLLDYCDLPFEDSCLTFYENQRAVNTASSEQVRRPIYREGLQHWRHYEPWLEPLKAELGPLVDSYAAAE